MSRPDRIFQCSRMYFQAVANHGSVFISVPIRDVILPLSSFSSENLIQSPTYLIRVGQLTGRGSAPAAAESLHIIGGFERDHYIQDASRAAVAVWLVYVATTLALQLSCNQPDFLTNITAGRSRVKSQITFLIQTSVSVDKTYMAMQCKYQWTSSTDQ